MPEAMRVSPFEHGPCGEVEEDIGGGHAHTQVVEGEGARVRHHLNVLQGEGLVVSSWIARPQTKSMPGDETTQRSD